MIHDLVYTDGELREQFEAYIKSLEAVRYSLEGDEHNEYRSPPTFYMWTGFCIAADVERISKNKPQDSGVETLLKRVLENAETKTEDSLYSFVDGVHYTIEWVTDDASWCLQVGTGERFSQDLMYNCRWSGAKPALEDALREAIKGSEVMDGK